MPQNASDWFLDELFWVDAYPLLFPEGSFEEAATAVDRIVELTERKDGTFLDLCCGPGRHAVPAARRGFTVTGVDRSGHLLSGARAYAAAEGVEVEWVQKDMRRFDRPGAFGLIVNLTTSFGFFDDDADNLKVLRNACSSLAEGGLFVLDLMGKEILARDFQPTSSSELPDGRIAVQRRGVSDDWGRMDAEWLFIDGERVRTHRFRLRLYSGRELRGALAAAGFSSVRLYGDLEGRPYGPDAARLIAVAGKGPGSVPDR